MVWITLYPLMKRHFPKQITYLKYFLRREFLIRQTRFSKVRIQRHLCHATPRSRQCDGLLVVSIHPILKYYVMGIKINNRIWWGSNGHVYGSLSLCVCKFHFEKKKGSNLGIPYFQKKNKFPLSLYIIYIIFISIYISIKPSSFQVGNGKTRTTLNRNQQPVTGNVTCCWSIGLGGLR